MDSLHVDKTISDFNNDFEVEKFAKQLQGFKYGLEQVFGIPQYDTNHILKQLDALSKSELEKVIEHCNMLIERNNIEMGGV